MKKHRGIFHTLVAAVFILAVTIFPHHHHDGGVPCWILEVCQCDGQTNDEHTEHGCKPQDAHHAQYLPSVQKAGVVAKYRDMGSGDNGFAFLHPDFWTSQFTFVFSFAKGEKLLVQTFLLPQRERGSVSRRGPPVI